MSRKVESKGLRQERHSIEFACTEIQDPSNRRYRGRDEGEVGGQRAHPGFPPHCGALNRKMHPGRYRGGGCDGRGASRSDQGRFAIVCVCVCVIDGTSSCIALWVFASFLLFLCFSIFSEQRSVSIHQVRIMSLHTWKKRDREGRRQRRVTISGRKTATGNNIPVFFVYRDA